jgi:hypothetical protein
MLHGCHLLVVKPMESDLDWSINDNIQKLQKLGHFTGVTGRLASSLSFTLRRPGFAPGSVHVEFYDGQRGTGTGFSVEFFGFLLLVSFHHGSPYSYTIWRIIGLLVAAVQRHTTT